MLAEENPQQYLGIVAEIQHKLGFNLVKTDLDQAEV